MKFPLNLNFFSKGKKDLDDGKDDDSEDEENGEKEENGEEKENGEEDASRFGGLIAKLKIGGLIAKLKEDKRLALMAAGGAVAVLAVIAGGAWLLADGEESAQTAKTPSDADYVIVEISSGAKVVQKLPPRGSSSFPADGFLTQPQGQFAGNAPETGSPGAFQGPNSSVMVTLVTRDSFKGAPEATSGAPLSKAPDDELVEASPQGPLPKISDDGRKPWRVYSRPFDAPGDFPRIAIVVTGMGLSAAATEAAIKRLPGAVTLAFDANVKDYALWSEAARKAGHEILMSLPMESAKFPVHDPGPLAMMTTLKPTQNLERLDYILSRITGYVGVASTMGSGFSLYEKSLRPILNAIKNRGLMLIDGGADPKSLAPKIATEISLPRAVNDLFLDKDPSKAAIDAQLVKLEGIARENAVAVAFAEPNPSTIIRLSAWIATLKSKNLALAPITAIADRQIAP